MGKTRAKVRKVRVYPKKGHSWIGYVVGYSTNDKRERTNVLVAQKPRWKWSSRLRKQVRKRVFTKDDSLRAFMRHNYYRLPMSGKGKTWEYI